MTFENVGWLQKRSPSPSSLKAVSMVERICGTSLKPIVKEWMDDGMQKLGR